MDDTLLAVSGHILDCLKLVVSPPYGATVDKFCPGSIADPTTWQSCCGCPRVRPLLACARGLKPAGIGRCWTYMQSDTRCIHRTNDDAVTIPEESVFAGVWVAESHIHTFQHC